MKSCAINITFQLKFFMASNYVVSHQVSFLAFSSKRNRQEKHVT